LGKTKIKTRFSKKERLINLQTRFESQSTNHQPFKPLFKPVREFFSTKESTVACSASIMEIL